MLTGTLSLVLPVAASAAKLAIDEVTYKALEKQLDLGKTCADAMINEGLIHAYPSESVTRIS
ncbi:MAG TPA: hypothetical protein VF290_21395 [Pyrinomonadaceae bacterium]